MDAYERLSSYEQWMVRSNLKTIAEGGVTASHLVATLRTNDYGRVADAVEFLTSAS
jgi:hypothetical protein